MVNHDVLLSFIIPVYNVELYLQECIESILYQITDECEMILVNDGSTDSSGDICRRYAEQSALIKLVNQENGGLSSARNAGMAAAQGRYITFVDSDDKLYPDAVADVLRWIKNEAADLCFLQTDKLYSDGSLISLGEGIVREELHLQTRVNAVRHLATRPKYPGSAWGKLYRREFLLANDLHFPHDRRYSEDLGFIRDCILLAQRMDYLDISFYQYRQNRAGSITNRISSKNFCDLLQFITESAGKLTIDQKARDAVSRYAMGFAAYEYAVLLNMYPLIPDADKRAAIKKLNEFKWVLRYAMNTKGRVVSYCCGIIGIRLTSFLVHQYRKRA